MLNKFYSSTKWFIVIGLVSTLIHYLVAVGFELFKILSTEHSNIAGFIFAFPVSYFGHRSYTFSNQKSNHITSLPRFLLVSFLGFISNQAIVVLLIKYTIMPFWLALAFAISIVAVSFYLISRYWVFK
jgi:putative flippase GtrA